MSVQKNTQKAPRVIGYIRRDIIASLGLNILPDTPVYLGESNEEHIKNRHPYEYEKYFPYISEIINAPDYIGKSPKDNSLLFVKLYSVQQEYIRVAVKITPSQNCFAKTLHLLSTYNAERYIEKGTLKSLTQNENHV